MAVNYQRYESPNPEIITISKSTKAIIELEGSISEPSHIERSEELANSPELEISELFDKLREYAREHHQSVLELVGEYLLNDLPYSVGNVIRQKLEDRHPQGKPEGRKFEGLFASGCSDLSERMEEILYGKVSDDSEDVK